MDRSSHQAGEVAESTTSCIVLSGDPAAPSRWQDLLSPLGIRVVPEMPSSLSAFQSLVRREAPAFLLAHGLDLETALSALSIRAVLHPPVVLFSEREPKAAHHERARMAGVARVVWSSRLDEDDDAALRTIAGAAGWFKGALEAMDLSDMLQMFATRQRTAVISISCPHAKDLSPVPWDTATRCDGERSCVGWTGRLYVHKGLLVHAEAPGASGVRALAQMMQIHRGTLRVSEVFIQPAERNVSGSVQSNILNAALLIDHQARDDDAPTVAMPGPPPVKAAEPAAPAAPRISSPTPTPRSVPFSRIVLPSPAMRAAPPSPGDGSGKGSSASASPGTATQRPDHQGPAEMNELDPILKQVSGAVGVARGDAEGNVQALAGKIDAESACAVAQMCVPHMERMAEAVGFGPLMSWAASNSKMSLVARVAGGGVTLVAAGPTKSPEAAMKKLEAISEEGA